MLRALVIAVVIALTFAQGAMAGSKKAEAADDGPYVDLAAVGLPIIVDGKVKNYVFVETRLLVARGQDWLKLRESEPYYRDALVRAAHRTPFVVAGNWTLVDEGRLKAVMLAEARRISGPKAFSGVEVRSQAPRKRVGMIAGKGPAH